PRRRGWRSSTQLLRHRDGPLGIACRAVQRPRDFVAAPDVQVDAAHSVGARFALDELERLSAQPLPSGPLLDEEVVHVCTVRAPRRPEHSAERLTGRLVFDDGDPVIRSPDALGEERSMIRTRLLLGFLRGHPGLLDEAARVLGAQGVEVTAELVIAERPKPNVHRYVWIWYFDTQSFTVVQSRLSKN